MLRRDYILQMIQDCVRMLSRIGELRQSQRWQEAEAAVDDEFTRLIGSGAEAVSRMSELELFAAIVKSEPTLTMREKTLMVTALLKEAGDVAAGQGKIEAARASYLKGLHLLLETLAQDDSIVVPSFVPRIDVFVRALESAALPPRTLAMLMQYYERNGAFAKAEDMLFELLEASPSSPEMLDFGTAFYARLRKQTDAALSEGNLPRAEVETGLEELIARKTKNVLPIE